MDELEDDYLEHHGVKGMHWGVRKSRPTSSGRARGASPETNTSSSGKAKKPNPSTVEGKLSDDYIAISKAKARRRKAIGKKAKKIGVRAYKAMTIGLIAAQFIMLSQKRNLVMPNESGLALSHADGEDLTDEDLDNFDEDIEMPGWLLSHATEVHPEKYMDC